MATKKKLSLKKTDAYNAWYDAIKDETTKARLFRRLVRAEEEGDFGDCGSVGGGVYELRFHFGPGWRIYYFQADADIYWLLCGGIKDTQPEDVRLAKRIKEKVEGFNARS